MSIYNDPNWEKARSAPIVQHYVLQKASSDCGLACAAMALNVPYGDLHKMIGMSMYRAIRKNGMFGEQIKDVLQAFGCMDNEDFTRMYPSPHYCSVRYMRNSMWGRKAIIQVRSVNYWDGFHYIYWDGNHVLDPSTKKRYEYFDDVEPMSCYLFHWSWKGAYL